MDFDDTLKLLRQRQQESGAEMSYSQIYYKLQQVTDISKITELIKALLKKFTYNRDRDTFFQLNFPVIIFKFALLKFNEFSIFYHCSVLLNKVLSETPEKTKNLEDYIIKYLHKPQYNETLQFYILVGNMCTSSTSAEAMLHSAIPTLLVKFYHSKISSKSKNTQIFESLDYETLKTAEDSENSDSDKSGATIASSLSLDEDIAYRRNEENKPLSARSILSDFANTLLDDDDQQLAPQDNLSDRQDDFEGQSTDYKADIKDQVSACDYLTDSRYGEDFENTGMNSDKLEHDFEPEEEAYDESGEEQLAEMPLNSERPVSQLRNLPQKPVIAKSKYPGYYPENPAVDSNAYSMYENADNPQNVATKQPAFALQVQEYVLPKRQFYQAANQTSDMLQINSNQFDYVRQKEILAIAGPLCLPMKQLQKPKFIPNLDIKVLRDLDQNVLQEDIIGNRQRFEAYYMPNFTKSGTQKYLSSPLARGKKSDSLIDQTFLKQLYFIDEYRKGSIIVQEIGQLLGQFMAMSEYPVITTLIKNDASEYIDPPELPDRAGVYRERYFSNQNAREVFDYNFNFTYFQKVMYVYDELTIRDIQRLGVIFVLHVLTRYSPQLTVQAIPSTHVYFTHDMMDMRSAKTGFLPASLLALHTLMTEMAQARLTLQLDYWQNALSYMQTHVFSEFYYINAREEVETTKNDKHAYVQRTITLPSLVYLLERLEGTRRRLLPEMRLLATKLHDLVCLYRNLSAVEDMPHIIGVLIDRLESSYGSKVMRACAVELLLPSIMKLIDLLLTKKIKNRYFYVFISHKVIYLLSVLMKTNAESRDFYQANIDQIFLKMMVFDASDIAPWLRRYGYLMLVTSRVYVELSGLFIDAKQCEETFEQIRISFAYFCGNLAKLVRNFFFYRFNSMEDMKTVRNSRVFVPAEANLTENGIYIENNEECDMERKTNISQLPVHSLCEYLVDYERLFNVPSEQYFVKQHNCIYNKEVFNGMQIDFSEYLFLIDFNTGVLTQYTMLSQANVLKQEKDRLVYCNCIAAIRDLISIPNFFNVILAHYLNKHIIYHYTAFLKFYNLALSQLQQKFAITAFYLADAHLYVLIELANTGDSAIRRYLLIVKIVEFLTQQIMYESLSDAEKALNRLQKTSLLPTYRANDSEDTLSELDFGLDDEKPVLAQTSLPPAIADLRLHFDELEQQAKEQKSGNTKIESAYPNMVQLFDEPEEYQDVQAIHIGFSEEYLANQADTAFNLVTERENAETESSRMHSSQVPTFGLPLRFPDPTLVYHKSNEHQEIDSDMDGWENTAARLKIDLNSQKDTAGASYRHEFPGNEKADFSDSDDIPLSKPIQKLHFGIQLNLNTVQEKKADLKAKQELSLPIQAIEKPDLNLKMHLVLANYSTRKYAEHAAAPATDQHFDGTPGNDQLSLSQDDEIKLFGEQKVRNDSTEDIEVPYYPIYYDDSLHFSVIKLILTLIVNPKTGGLDSNYVTQFPTNNGLMNIPVVLHKHLNSKRNVKIVEMLIKARFNQSTRRLLRLLCYSQFNPEYYDLKKYRLLAKGAYGEVYSGYINVTYNQQHFKHAVPAAVKLQKLSTGLQDRCVLHDIFQEVTALEKVQEDNRFCYLYDYGVTPQGYIIVMQKYYTSFKNFREKLFERDEKPLRYSNPARKMAYYGHEYSMMKFVRLFLLTYIAFLKQLLILHEEYKVIHFDLKCDNLFISPASVKWMAQRSSPEDMDEFAGDILSKHLNAKNDSYLPFVVSLSDFGESHIFSAENDENTLLSKGTEFNKSPEMLVATNQQFAKSFNRRRQKGAGLPSDVWSAACTLYEMLTNDYLFYDSDWIRFFLRVTSIIPGAEYARDSATFGKSSYFSTLVRGVRLSPEKRAMLGNCVPLIDLLEFQLVQDPAKRPTIPKIIEMTQLVLDEYFTLDYRFDAVKYAKAIKTDASVEDNVAAFALFQFSIEAAQELCMANPAEILAPKCSVIVKDDNITGSKLTQVTLKYSEMSPADLLMNGQILLGSVHDVQDVKYMNGTNVSTVVDCTFTSTKSESKITTISHVYRPDLRLFEIYCGSDQRSAKMNFRDLVIALEEVFDVVRCALVKNSSVFLADESGCVFAACVAVACLMEFENMNLYPAVIYLKRIRPAVELKLQFLDFLYSWHDNRTKIGVKMISMFAHLQINPKISLNQPEYYQLASYRIAEANYRCLCGKVFFVQKLFTDVNFVLCNCVCSKRTRTTLRNGKPCSCPSPSCRTLQNYYLSLYGFKMHKMLYAYGRDDDFISNWTRATIYTENTPEFRVAENQQIQFRTVDNMRNPLYRMGKKDGWSLFICRICGSPTHFIRVEAGEDYRQICVICNVSNR